VKLTPRLCLSFAIVILIGTGFAALAAAPSIASRWRDKEIVTDGRIAEWTELTSFEGGVSVAAFNDERDLFLAIATSDPLRRRHFLAAGLIIWLDPAGGKRQSYGIRIPGAGMALDGQRPMRSRDEDSQDARGLRQPDLTYIELIGPKKDDRRRIQLSAESGISAGARVEDGTLLYEIRVPHGAASASDLHALGARLDRPLGLGLQTPKLERDQRAQRSPGGMGGIGGGGRGRGGMGGRGSGGTRGRAGSAGQRPEQMKALNLWTTVNLARQGNR
jgi:hypothetical protein